MPDDLRERTGELRKQRLATLIITRSPSSPGEIPEDNLAERDTDDRKRDQLQEEQGDAGEVNQEG